MRRIIIVGDSLFAETLTRTLADSGTVEVIGAAPTLEAALPMLKTKYPDALIVADMGAKSSEAIGQCLAAYPDLPIIHADLSANNVQVITSQRLSARSSDLLAAIAALPKRSP